MKIAKTIAVVLALTALLACSPPETENRVSDTTDPLPSWNDGAARAAIIDFVDRVTDPASPDYVPEAERVATFDNDGTLWAEQPLYFQLFFAIDRVYLLVPAQAYVGNFLKTFKEFPPRQKAASFSLDQVMEKLAPPGS